MILTNNGTTLRRLEITNDELISISKEIEDEILSSPNCEGHNKVLTLDFSINKYHGDEFGYVVIAEFYDIANKRLEKLSTEVRVSNKERTKEISKERFLNAAKLIWNKVVRRNNNNGKFKSFEEADYAPWA